MGTVYWAQAACTLGDEVAIKVLQPSDASPSALRERFLRESRIAAQLRHPHVVAISRFQRRSRGLAALVMELLNGRSLRQELADAGPFARARAGDRAAACTALQMAHDRGILHRDLKPANIVAHRFGARPSTRIIDSRARQHARGERRRV
jgi:serine/threonine protein kinase